MYPLLVGRDDGQPAGEAQMKFATVFIGLMAANFLFQAFTGQQWGVAFERSFFQGVALLVAYGAAS